MVAFLRPLDSTTFHISCSHLHPGLSLLEEEASASVPELVGAWGLSQLVWGMRYSLLSASGNGYSSPSEWYFQKMPAGPLLWVPSLFQISPVPSAPSPSRSLQPLPSRPLALTSFGKRRSKPIWETLPAEEAGPMSRSARLYLTGYICSPTHLSQPWPRLPPLSPLGSLSCTIQPHVAPARPAPAVQLWSGPQAIFCLVPKIIQLSGMCV